MCVIHKLANDFDATSQLLVNSQSVSHCFNCVAQEAIPLKPCNIGKKASWVGTTINETTITNSQSRPGNDIQANAYAANAAMVIGIIVAGIVTINDEISAFGTFLFSNKTSI